MTAVATAPAPGRSGTPSRIVNAARIHAANPWGTLILPWIIYAAIFALTLAIWGLITMNAGGRQNLDAGAFLYNGGGTWVLFYMMVVAVQAMNQTFKFALGLCVTRREYYLGSALYFLFLSAIYTTGITLLGIVERATDGWGLQGSFFVPFWVQEASLAERWLALFGLFTVFFFLGAAVATVYVRWGSNGMIAFFATLSVLALAAVFVIVRFDLGPEVSGWFGARSLVQLVGLGLVASAVAGLVGFLLMRRATPRA